MIREFSVKPKPSNNKARALFIILMLLAFLLILISTLIDSYKGIVSLLGVISLSLALVIYTKYISPAYYYDITFDSGGLAVFVVRQLVGKRFTTLCRIALSDIVRVEKESAKERREHKTPMGVVKYSYLPTLDPAESHRITTSSKYEKAEILIEASDEFAGLIRSYSLEERERVRLEDEY